MRKLAQSKFKLFKFYRSGNGKENYIRLQPLGANMRIMDNINKRDRSPKFLGLVHKRQKKTKNRNFRSKNGNNLKRKVWINRKPNKRGRDEVDSVDLKLLFRIFERNHWVTGLFYCNDQEVGTSTKKTQELKNVSRTEKGDVVRSTAFFRLDLKDQLNTEKFLLFIKMIHVIDNPKLKYAKEEENLKKSRIWLYGRFEDTDL